MEIDFNEYQLRCELRGHEDDVRGICLCGDGGIATSSRDRTVRVWAVNPTDKWKYEAVKVLLGHTSFVGPLAYISPNDKFPEGGIASGGMDTVVIIWDLRNGDRVEMLKGHQMQVTGIALDNADVVSCSVDCTLRRWRSGKSIEVWDAHKAPIQAVIRLKSGELVTGSTDTTIKLWRDGTCIRTLTGHRDTVRGLAPMHGLGILSASHDGCIRLWAISGEVLMEMVGHSSIIYSVDSHVSGLIVSGSEDRFVKVWKDGVCVQSIEHPGCIWDVKFLEDGDIVTACSDGVVRIWTTQKDKIAGSVEIDLFASELSAYKRSRKRVGGLKLEELPGIEALHVPGTTGGQTKVIREGDNGVAYSWNSSEMKWDKIGEVVDGPDDSMKRPILDGIQYDYVFDVDIGDGEPVRKLPYNRSDNPYDRADKWLLKENLPLTYRQQVVEFILSNTGQSNFTLDHSFSDPYTGANAYVPGESSFMAAKPAKPIFNHIPKKGMLVFDVAQFDGILRKVLEFNGTLLSDQHKRNIFLSHLEIERLEALVKTLKDTSHYHSSEIADVDIILLLRLLKSWPDETIFPGVMGKVHTVAKEYKALLKDNLCSKVLHVFDLLRMTVLHPDGAAGLSKHINSSTDIFMEILKKATRNSNAMANFLTSIRAVVNLFKNSAFFGFLQQYRSEILDAYSSCSSSSNKNLQLSYSTLLLNYAVLLIEKKDSEGQSQVLSAALEVAEKEALEVDARFRALVAIGSLMLDGLVKQIALDFDVVNIAAAARTTKEPKIVEIGADIETLIKQN